MSSRPVTPRLWGTAIFVVLIGVCVLVPASRAQIGVPPVTAQLPVSPPALPPVSAPALPPVPAPSIPPVSSPSLPSAPAPVPSLPQPPAGAPQPGVPVPIPTPVAPVGSPTAPGVSLPGASEAVTQIVAGGSPQASGAGSGPASSGAQGQPGEAPSAKGRGRGPAARRAHERLRGRKLRHFRRVLHEHWGCADALSPRQRRVLRMRGGLFGRSPAARATIARRLGVSVRRVLRLERSGIAVLRRAGSCNKPAAGSAGDVPHGTFMPVGGAVYLTSGSTGASDRGRNKDVSGVLGAEMSHSAPLRASSSEADARSRTLLALLAFLVVLSALVLAAGIATRRSGVPPALLAKRFRRSLKPLLFMDVDGVLALWPLDVPADPPGRPLDVGGVRVYLCERGAEFLRELATRFEIVWATGWEDHANRLLGDVLELEEDLPTLRFGDRPAWGESEWKIPAVSHASGRRPAAWVDDSIGAGHRRWARRRGAPTLLVNVDSSEGLCEWHVRELIKWADEVDGGTGTPTAKNRAPTPA